MRFLACCGTAILLSTMAISQQNSSTLNARAIYYSEQTDDNPTALAETQTGERPPGANKGSNKHKTKPGQGSSSGNDPAQVSTAHTDGVINASSTASHSALRYNVLLIDSATNQETSVEPGRNFQPGECLALRVQANRSGYLYVLAQGSSGTWKPLIPSKDMPDEKNFINSGTLVRVPKDHCFAITGPSGTEKVFVAFSHKSADFDALQQSIRDGARGNPSAQGQVLSAKNNIGQEVARLTSLQDRDIDIVTVTQSQQPDELSNTVYVANTSADAGDKPLIIKVEISHQSK